jgi:ATP-dependent DNA ligase
LFANVVLDGGLSVGYCSFAPFSPFGLLSSRPMAFQPMPLSRRPLPFDHPEWIFELKYDGFRALAVIQNGLTQLISRNGHPFSFNLRVPLHAGKTVLDGGDRLRRPTRQTTIP